MLARRMLGENPRLRLILMSATVHTSLYTNYFKDCGVGPVGRAHRRTLVYESMYGMPQSRILRRDKPRCAMVYATAAWGPSGARTVAHWYYSHSVSRRNVARRGKPRCAMVYGTAWLAMGGYTAARHLLWRYTIAHTRLATARYTAATHHSTACHNKAQLATARYTAARHLL